MAHHARFSQRRRLIYLCVALLTLAGLGTACGGSAANSAVEDSSTTTDASGPTTAAPATTAVPPSTTPSTEVATTAATADDSTTTTEQMPETIPVPVQGTWRESEAVAVSEEECLQTAGYERNFGKVLTIRSDGYSFFETGGLLLEVFERDASRIDARYDTTYADTPTEQRVIFDAQEEENVLTVRESGDGARPSPVRYVRCP